MYATIGNIEMATWKEMLGWYLYDVANGPIFYCARR